MSIIQASSAKTLYNENKANYEQKLQDDTTNFINNTFNKNVEDACANLETYVTYSIQYLKKTINYGSIDDTSYNNSFIGQLKNAGYIVREDGNILKVSWNIVS